MTMEDEVRAVITSIEHDRGSGKLGVSPRDAHIDRSFEGLLALALQMARRIDRLEAESRSR